MAVLECAEEPFWILAPFFRLRIVAHLQPVTQSEQVQGVELQEDRFIFLVIYLFCSFHDCLCFKVRGISQVISNNALPYNFPNNDWIILKLDQPLNLGGDVQAACLPPSSSYLPLTASKEDCWTSGWGHQFSGIVFNELNHFCTIVRTSHYFFLICRWFFTNNVEICQSGKYFTHLHWPISSLK